MFLYNCMCRLTVPINCVCRICHTVQFNTGDIDTIDTIDRYFLISPVVYIDLYVNILIKITEKLFDLSFVTVRFNMRPKLCCLRLRVSTNLPNRLSEIEPNLLFYDTTI